jgi:hypothetical protein
MNRFLKKDIDPVGNWLRSDYCTDCGGKGYIEENHEAPYGWQEYQCEQCEELHEKELQADILQDEIKEG